MMNEFMARMEYMTLLRSIGPSFKFSINIGEMLVSHSRFSFLSSPLNLNCQRNILKNVKSFRIAKNDSSSHKNNLVIGL